ncbi:MAG: hypothetical protein GXX95_10095 [Methanomassiliicoccus sp.]|nr:hypothetical protein [Methanomassiliicoccus sp.]
MAGPGRHRYTVTEMGDNWVLTFTYGHSYHAVLVGMPTLSASSGIGEFSMKVLAIVVVVAVAAVGALHFLLSGRRKK